MNKNTLKTALAAVLIAAGGCAKQETAPEAALEGSASSAAETAPALAASAASDSAVNYAALLPVNDWKENEQYCMQYELALTPTRDISSWRVVLAVSEDTHLQQIWNAKESCSESEWTLDSVEYNSELKAGQALKDVGFIVRSSKKEAPVILTLLLDGAETAFDNAPAETMKPSQTVTSIPAAEPVGLLHVENGKLVGAKGETVQLRGVSTHGIAWYPEYVNREAFETLRDDWNVNTIRLAMYTAENGGYCTGGDREKLLKLIDDGVRYTEELGMYVIIDWHILTDKDPRDHETEAIEFFSAMAEKYQDRTHVIYEICNEPQNSDFAGIIRPYAQHVIAAIRQYAKDAIILVGTDNWCQDIDRVEGFELDDPNVMYTFHFYAATHKDDLRRRLKSALDKGLPVYISECSICDASGNGAIDEESARAWFDLINSYQLSYNAWSLANKNETSALIRPDCQKTSGWSEEDLSDTGRWFRKIMRGE